MANPIFLAADFTQAMKRLMPRGRAWPTWDDNSALSRILSGLAPTYEQSAAAVRSLITEAFPPTTEELIEEWEASLGLPDPCAGLAATLQARRNQVVARFVALNDPTVDNLIAFAALLGFTITITEDATPNHFIVNAPLETVVYFRCDDTSCETPLETSNNDVLECEIREIKPAHTSVDFNYT